MKRLLANWWVVFIDVIINFNLIVEIVELILRGFVRNIVRINPDNYYNFYREKVTIIIKILFSIINKLLKKNPLTIKLTIKK